MSKIAVTLVSISLLSEPAKLNDDGKVIKKAVVKQIPPRHLVEMEDDQFEELEEAGAVREATKKDIATAQHSDDGKTDPEGAAAFEGQPSASTPKTGTTRAARGRPKAAR